MTGTCDGRGACARYPRGTTCAAQTCLGDTITAPATCDGIGTCVGGFKISCVPFTCDQARGQCFSACMSDAQCAANTSCTGNLCGIRQNTPCTIDAECATGFCAQGVCCNAPCRSPCVSCGLAGHVGQCTPVPVVGALDPSGTCVDQGPSSCGTNGRCDGNGGCALYPPGTICSAPTCVGDKLTFSGFCDVQMTCVAPSATSCAPFTCRTDVPMCHAGCPNGDAICPPDAYCTGDEQCVPKKPPGGPCQSDHECQSSVCTPTPDGGVATCAGFI